MWCFGEVFGRAWHQDGIYADSQLLIMTQKQAVLTISLDGSTWEVDRTVGLAGCVQTEPQRMGIGQETVHCCAIWKMRSQYMRKTSL